MTTPSATRGPRRLHWMADLADDGRYALRSLRRAPGLSAFVILTLALGIGMTSTPLSMLDALIFRPYPVPNPGDVVTLVGTSRDVAYDPFSYREYLDIRDHTTSYDGVVASGELKGVAFVAEPGATPRVKGGMLVSGNYFRVLGVEPRLGRGFREDEDEVPGRDAVAILGPDFWRHEFGGDPSVVGRRIRLNATDFTVIGVAPESFVGMQIFSRPDVYVPLAMAGLFSPNPRKNPLEDRDARELNVKARLRSGTTLDRARSEIAALARTFEQDYPRTNRGRGATVRTMLEMRTRDDAGEWKFSVIFSILALSVLLVACTNVAGLLLSRARTRTREIAVRLALGAGRFRLVRLLLTESLVLAALGGTVGVAIGGASIQLMRTFSIPSELPVTIPFRMDGRLLLVSLALAFASAIACGLAPALQSARTDLVTGLKSADADVPGTKRLRGRSALVVAQVSISLMLLTAAFLMARSFERDVREGTGFAKDHLLLAGFDPRLVQADEKQTARFYELLTDRARVLPGVKSVALTQNPPLGLGDFSRLAFVPEGHQMPRERENVSSLLDTVDEGYFETMGVPIVRGRGFLATDGAEAPRVAVVNEQLARHYWPGSDAVGKRLRLGSVSGTPVEIVGVAQTIKYRDNTSKKLDFVYLPLAQRPVPKMVLLLRSAGDPLGLVKPLEDVVRSIDPNLPMLEVRTYEDVFRYNAVEGPGVAIKLVGTMGAVGLVLAVAGLYGVVAYGVSRRTREIGIRMAIGAAPSDVLRLVMGKGLALVASGTVVGLALSAALERLMNAMLFDAGGVDVVAYAAVVPSLLLVTLLAAWVPARRAARIAPTEALRYE